MPLQWPLTVTLYRYSVGNMLFTVLPFCIAVKLSLEFCYSCKRSGSQKHRFEPMWQKLGIIYCFFRTRKSEIIQGRLSASEISDVFKYIDIYRPD